MVSRLYKQRSISIFSINSPFLDSKTLSVIVCTLKMIDIFLLVDISLSILIIKDKIKIDILQLMCTCTVVKNIFSRGKKIASLAADQNIPPPDPEN